MQIMGILNVTPDSFSDGGRWFDPQAAIAHGQDLLSAGADLIDIGGESTRPGSVPVSVEEEQRRILPVVRALSEQEAVLSVDTMNAVTARAAMAAGARYINDVSGGLLDAGMISAVADTGAQVILSHWRGRLGSAEDHSDYTDVTGEVAQQLSERMDAFERGGVAASQIILDPGLGFSKTAEQNWTILRELDRLQSLGQPLLIGASRKRFLAGGRTTTGDAADLAARDAATATITVALAARGIWGVRVHDVAGSVAALRTARQLGEERSA